MNLQKREKILLCVLSGALVIFLLDMFVFSSKSPQKTKIKRETQLSPQRKNAKKRPQVSRSNISTQKKSLKASFRQTIDPDIISEWRRDPFLGVFTVELLDSLRKKKGISELVLKAISWRDSLAYVIINDDVYREGESKNGMHIIDVSKDKVICFYKGRRRTLSFEE